ncbi:MAG: HD-like signal output (HDOD) protein [Planctomycetota bacterium]|jgi:HD-like signal output (HDOD) protein
MKYELKSLDSIINIPSLPSVVARVCEMVEDEGTGIREIGDTVAEDAPMTAAVLRMANSSIYGLERTIGTAAEAATVLGARRLRNLVLQASVLEEYDELRWATTVDIDAIWKHALLVGQLTKRLTSACGYSMAPHPEDAYNFGLLHDLGRMALIDTLGAEYLALLEEAKHRGVAAHDFEITSLGFSHQDAGARIAEVWGLPAALVDAVGHHHDIHAAKDARAAALVACSDRLAHSVASEEPLQTCEVVPARIQMALRLRPDQLEDWMEFSLDAYRMIAKASLT